jgi:hypothetical protein
VSELPLLTVIGRENAHTTGAEIRKNGVTVSHVESSRELSFLQFEKTYEIIGERDSHLIWVVIRITEGQMSRWTPYEHCDGRRKSVGGKKCPRNSPTIKLREIAFND